VVQQPAAIFEAMSTIRLRFLGTGTSQGVPVVACACSVCRSTDPRDARLRSSVLLSVGGADLLIDAGPDLRQQLLRAQISSVDAVLLTHDHMDHVAGLDDLRALNFHLRRPMDIHSNADTLASIRRMYHYAFAEDRYPGVPELRLHEVPGDRMHVAGVDLEVITVMHGHMPVLGFRHGPLAYITDAKWIAPDQLDRLRGLEVLVINALRIKEHPTHFNLAEALDIVAELAPKRAYFTHISHLLGLHADVEGTLPPNVQLAVDGLEVLVEG
jgi:phosphoribosyl 1,2-cyclic phosphate phosphodiesterase